MALELVINGNLNVYFSHIETNKEVCVNEENQILKKLISGEYIISLSKKIVYDLNINPLKPIYKFSFEPMDVEYEWNETI